MKFLLIVASAICCLNGQPRSAIFDGNTSLSFTPTSAAATQLGSYRIDFRISEFAANDHMQGIVGNNNGDTQCVLAPGTVDLRCRNWQGGPESIQLNLADRRDIRARYQRDNSTRVESLEIWNADGSGYQATSRIMAPVYYNAAKINYIGSVWGMGSEFTGKINFVRWYSTPVPVNSRLPTDSISTTANILDIEFASGVSDLSPSKTPISLLFGSIKYAAASTFPPVAQASGAVVTTGTTALLDGTASSSVSSDQALTSQWSCVSAPASCNIANSNSAVASLSAKASGTYLIQLRVTDKQGKSSSVTVEIGSVPTDASGIVRLPNRSLDLAIGPLTRSGTSPWTWFDKTEIAAADSIIKAIPAAPGSVQQPGTLSVTAGSTMVYGTGTRFKSTFVCDGSDNVMIYYPIPGELPGRRLYGVVSCPTDSQLVLSHEYDASSSSGGVAYSKASNIENYQWVNGSNNWNYYDCVVALYRAYYRTGFERFRTAARSLADKWYAYPLDRGRAWKTGSGYWQMAPRMVALTGIMLRANDGRPEYWDAITAIGEYWNTWLTGWYPWNSGMEVGDIREQGYVSLGAVMIANLHPDAGVQSRFRGYALTAFRSWWQPTQRPDGGWYFTLGANQNYYGTGTMPWQGAFTATYLVALHRLTGDATVLASLKKFADFMAQYGIDPINDGGYYDAFYKFCPNDGVAGTGSVNVTNGGAVVSGNGTSFKSTFSCNTGDAIAIQDSTGFRRFFTVASCTTDGGLQLDSQYSGMSESGLRYLKYASASPVSGCGVCPWGTCGTFGPAAARDARSLLDGSHSYWGYLYSVGQGAKYKDIGDRLFAKNLGPNGPGGDLQHGHYDDAVANAAVFMAKSFAFVGGAAGAQPYLAWRIGQQTLPVNVVKLNIPMSPPSPGQWSTARVVLTRPDGTTLETPCVGEHCIIEADTETPGYQYEVEYLDATGAVVAKSGLRSVGVSARLSIE
jgi:hypothetical protein